ncbi:MAG: ABC transporter permease [Anaerolineae bacterium]
MTMAEFSLRSTLENVVGNIVTFVRLMSRNRVGFIGFLAVIGFILLALIGPYFVELDTKTNVAEIYQPPSWEHPLGTDHQGRDIWAQIVHGGRDILYVAFIAGIISTLIAITFGSLAAITGRVVDSTIMTITDIVLTIPQFPLLAVLAAFVRLNSLTLLAVLLALLSWPTLLRAVRSQVLSLKERDYVEAAVALDMGLRHIIFSEILPNMMSYIIISFTLAMTGAIYAQVGLIFLGLVPMSGQNWAVMIQLAWVRGAIFFKDSIYYIMSPVLAIALFQLSLVSMTRSLEEVFNPRLRVGV